MHGAAQASPHGPAIAFEKVVETAYPADREHLERAVQRAVAAGDQFDVEYRVPVPDGSVRWIAARGRAEKGKRQQMLGVAVDITERKLADLRAVEDRNALRHMTRVSMLGQLSASIAHQLNQPLAAILGNAEAARKMLAKERVDLAELREICDDIVADDNRAAEVIRRLGALYRRGDMRTDTLDLNELIRETLDLLRAELLIRHVTPRTELAPVLPVIEGGRVQLQQVLLNLVLNAADAMIDVDVAKRSLAIRTEATGAEVRLYVDDNGHGIPRDDLKRVFDPFYSTKPGGMGIGLAICQTIVAAHHGSILATNNPEGGTTFFRYLAGGGCDMTEASATPTIFLVDDDPSVLKALSRVLREDGFSVETFDSAEAFLARPDRKAEGVPGARRDDARPRRPRTATPPRGRRRIAADRVHQRARRHSDVRARHQGGARRIS
jgi:C4-dicarboxylate-specific signal transduction histidine kinase